MPATSAVWVRARWPTRRTRRLRSVEQRRRLDRWAGFRREGRAAKKKQAAEGAARGKVASLADWLRRRWAAGG